MPIQRLNKPIANRRAGPPPGPARRAPDSLVGPTWLGTKLILASLVIAWFLLGGRRGSDIAHNAAIVVGIGILLSAIADSYRGLANLVRADLFAILSFYFLTLFEFLFPQANYDRLVSAPATVMPVIICLWSFAGLAIGRHLARARGQPFRQVLTTPISSGDMMLMFVLSIVGGYLNMLVAVHFNVYEMVDAFLLPRFSQPWSRGRLGDWKALFDEIGMILYLLPPMAGIMLARRREYNIVQLSVVVLALLFTLFYGYTGGTRNIFDSYLVTFLTGYAFATRKERRHELFYVGAICAALLIFSTVTMTKFREIGLRDYLSGEMNIEQPRDTELLAVDLDLYPLSEIAQTFPARHDYLGFQIIYLALIRPIPRAVWHNKPEGMTVSIESLVGAGDTWTVSASFVGETYMSGGMIAVFLIAAGFGWLAGWWNRLASPENSQLGWLIYASGFFAVVISMRSVLYFTTAILPTLVAFGLTAYITGKGVHGARRVLRGGGRRPGLARPRPVPSITRQ